MNRCSEYQELISRLIDQDLNEEEERALREHMAECEDCRAMYEFMTQMSDSVAESLEDLPEGLHENIMAQVRRQAIREKNQPRRILQVVLSTAAVAVLVVILMFLLLRYTNIYIVTTEFISELFIPSKYPRCCRSHCNNRFT